MDVVTSSFELAGSRVFDAKTKQIKLSDQELNVLHSMVQACQTKDGNGNVKTSLLKAQAFCNMDAGRDVVTAPAGVMTLHDPDAIVTPDMISDEMFQYFALIPVPHPEDLNKEYDDAYFQTEEARQRLNEAVPQYGESPYSIATHRHRRNNRDTKVWEAELGQTNSWAGILKAREEDGEDCEYYAVARAGSPYACAELRAMVADRANGSQKPMTWREFDLCKETGAVRSNAQLNARRLAFNVGTAMQVTVESIQDGEAAGKVKPSMIWGEKMVCQHVSMVDEVSNNEVKGVPNGSCIGIFNEVTPAHRVQKDLYVLGSGADVVLRFHMDEYRPNDVVGVPCTTGRKLELPENAAAVKERIEGDAKLKKYHDKVASRFVWEGVDQLPYHPDIHPQSHYSAVPRKDQTFVKQLCQLGWDRSASYDVLQPVMVKLCNPYLKRPVTSQKKTAPQGDAMAAFD